jgi:hypothetical protein
LTGFELLGCQLTITVLIEVRKGRRIGGIPHGHALRRAFRHALLMGCFELLLGNGSVAVLVTAGEYHGVWRGLR